MRVRGSLCRWAAKKPHDQEAKRIEQRRKKQTPFLILRKPQLQLVQRSCQDVHVEDPQNHPSKDRTPAPDPPLGVGVPRFPPPASRFQSNREENDQNRVQ